MFPIRRLRTARPDRLYYGWYIVGAAIIAQMMAVGLQSFAMGVFLKPMTADLGWSREDFANVQTISTIITGGLGFFLGTLLDRRGSRPLMIGGALVSGLCLIASARVQSLTEFYLVRGIGFTIGAMGIGHLVVNVTVARWFVRNRGMAVALASMGLSLGGVVMTPAVQALISWYGWRDAWVILGVLTWVVLVPTALVMRRTPEDYGLLPDGDTPDGVPPPARGGRLRPAAPEVNWTRAEAIRTTTLWVLIIAWGMGTVGMVTMLLHAFSFFTDNGFSAGIAAVMVGVQSWCSLFSKPVWGMLMNRFHPRYLSAVSFAGSGMALALLAVTGGSASFIGAALAMGLFGLASGGTAPLSETVWASYYGRLHLGKIRSVGMPFSIIFSALGPKFAANVYDQSGSYHAAFFTFTGLYVVSALLILLARQPRRRTSPVLVPLPAPDGSR